MDACDLGGGSGPPILHTGGAKNLWVKKNHHTMGERLKIATYNVRTLLKDEHVQEKVLYGTVVYGTFCKTQFESVSITFGQMLLL